MKKTNKILPCLMMMAVLSSAAVGAIAIQNNVQHVKAASLPSKMPTALQGTWYTQTGDEINVSNNNIVGTYKGGKEKIDLPLKKYTGNVATFVDENLSFDDASSNDLTINAKLFKTKIAGQSALILSTDWSTQVLLKHKNNFKKAPFVSTQQFKKLKITKTNAKKYRGIWYRYRPEFKKYDTLKINKRGAVWTHYTETGKKQILKYSQKYLTKNGSLSTKSFARFQMVDRSGRVTMARYIFTKSKKHVNVPSGFQGKWTSNGLRDELKVKKNGILYDMFDENIIQDSAFTDSQITRYYKSPKQLAATPDGYVAYAKVGKEKFLITFDARGALWQGGAKTTVYAHNDKTLDKFIQELDYQGQ